MSPEAQLNSSAPERSLLRLGVPPPTIGSVSDLLKGSLLASAEKRWPGIGGSPGETTGMTSQERGAISTARKELWAAWEGLRSGAKSEVPSLPFFLRGMVPLLDGWLEDLSAWQLTQLSEKTDWMLEVLAWSMNGRSGPKPLPQLPQFPCDLVGEWIPETTMVALLPAPGLAWLPGVLQFPSPEQVRSLALRCVGPGVEFRIERIGDPVWSPESESFQSLLLQAAHQQGAAYLVDLETTPEG